MAAYRIRRGSYRRAPNSGLATLGGVLFEPKPSSNRLSTLPTPPPVPVSGHPVVNLVMSTTQGPVRERPMFAAQGTPQNGTVRDAGDTSVRDAGDGILFS
jgi:hypothetical protein